MTEVARLEINDLLLHKSFLKLKYLWQQTLGNKLCICSIVMPKHTLEGKLLSVQNFFILDDWRQPGDDASKSTWQGGGSDNTNKDNRCVTAFVCRCIVKVQS